MIQTVTDAAGPAPSEPEAEKGKEDLDTVEKFVKLIKEKRHPHKNAFYIYKLEVAWTGYDESDNT